MNLYSLIQKILSEEIDSYYESELDNIASIINGIINNEDWQDHHRLLYSQNRSMIAQQIQSQISIYNFNDSVQENIIKAISKLLNQVQKLGRMPEKYVNERATYYDIRVFPQWIEFKNQIIQILQTNIQITEPLNHGKVLSDCVFK